ncbi:similar to Saccharomyces cerevisiae YJL065C DLS1 Subunit of ISW2/yCHRAC chromatin accessibility complex along with Itc1p, Isw2p, and Dpb4p [Maudiozyma saulgeensis]|uniref:Similar to Saccharomyces cerevisiae YJL065C DLS1 Subunit of ISW2/yCHRAC chromatin accessibility complex along with Itc1p, Isw2p, and Dpb4p n=1 Tax=Maudiozyma saulgeensis TaxID=1789683 RepID=A0A1X7R881_9SACH|nr:similar to Saccharomyces cerevisiae YJL065C DLS1 Subunit of ISW2/yCHRAC chromatin accessibility complex along with Itc1p, Isw2p, and Dpb4p [Kazachstania saulgeensis]
MTTELLDSSPEVKEDVSVPVQPITSLKEVVIEEGEPLPSPAELAQYMPALPIDKIQMIARNDPNYVELTDDAFGATAFATEFFVKTLTSEALKLSEYRSRSNSQTLELGYDDVADLVSMQKVYAFLRETIPRTKYLGDLVKENKVRYTTVVPAQQQRQQQQETVHQSELGQQPQAATNEIIEIDSSDEE